MPPTSQLLSVQTVAFQGLISERGWAQGFSRYIQRRVDRAEAQQWLQKMRQQGELVAVEVEGSREHWFVLSTDVPVLSALEAGGIPEIWRAPASTTDDEVVLLAPLDIVSTRGRARGLFEFDSLWEVYKPAAKRRWGYYTLPILYGDRLVARLDPRFDRVTATLVLNGFWLEEHAPGEAPGFAAALARGLAQFATFLNARRVDLAALEPATLRTQVQEQIGPALENVEVL